MGKTSSTVKDRYNAKVYDSFIVRVPKGTKSIIQSASSDLGESLNGYIFKAIQAQLERDAAELARIRQERAEREERERLEMERRSVSLDIEALI